MGFDIGKCVGFSAGKALVGASERSTVSISLPFCAATPASSASRSRKRSIQECMTSERGGTEECCGHEVKYR